MTVPMPGVVANRKLVHREPDPFTDAEEDRDDEDAGRFAARGRRTCGVGILDGGVGRGAGGCEADLSEDVGVGLAIAEEDDGADQERSGRLFTLYRHQ